MKYYIKNSKTEVQPGQLFKMSSEEDTPYGHAQRTTVFTLTEENIQKLLKKGILVSSIEEKEKKAIPTDLTFYTEKLRNKLGWFPSRFSILFSDFSSVGKAQVFSLLLKEIAITIDKQYPDHISKSPEWHYIAMTDGRIYKRATSPGNFKYISVFRTKQDARLALKILAPYHKELFPELYVKTE